MRTIFFWIFWIFSFPILSQESFQVFVDAKQLPEGSYLEVSFILKNADGTNFKLPEFKDFRIISGPSRSSSTSYINGVKSSELSYTYLIQPKKSGVLTIESASINVGNKTLTTKPLSISVLAKSEKPEELTQDEQTFILAEVDQSQAVLGQQIILNYKLYTRENIDQMSILEEPELKGFYVQELNRFDGRVIREIYQGKQYYTKLLRSMALFPQQVGKFEISPLVLQMGITDQDDQSPFGGSFFYSGPRKKITRSTNVVNIQVNNLPEEIPEDFIGAIGKYTVQTMASSLSITTDQMIQFRIIVEGDGDIKRVVEPPISFPSQFQVFPIKVLEESSFEIDGKISGKKIFDFTLLPKVSGTFPIQMTYSYFDTEANSFKTIGSDPFEIQVSQGTQTILTPNRGETDDQSISDEINPLKSNPILKSKSLLSWGSPTFYIVGFMPLFILLGSWIFQLYSHQKYNPESKKKSAISVAKKHLKKAEEFKKANQPSLFFKEIAQGMGGYINDKLEIPNSSLTKEEVSSRLVQLNIDTEKIQRFNEVLVECEKALYSGGDNSSQMEFTYHGAVDILADIEQALEKFNGRK
jgi:hypothetical protein